MSRHYGMQVHPAGFRLGGLSGGFGSAFEPGFTNPEPNLAVSTSVATSEARVSGTFAAQAPVLLSAAPTYDTPGQFSVPVQYLSDGQVVGGTAAPGGSGGGGFIPNTSPIDTVRRATSTANDSATNARDNNLDIPVDDNTEVWVDDSDFRIQLPVQSAPGFKMQWWHWALLGGAVLGGGYAVTRMIAR